MKQVIWTDNDDKIITDNPDRTPAELQQLLPDRTKQSIYWRRGYLKRQESEPAAIRLVPKPEKQSKPFSPEPVVLKTKADLILEPKPEPKPEYQKSFIQTESIQAKAEAAKALAGTYRDPKPTSDQIAAAVTARADQPSPILTDELTRLRCQVNRLEGVIEGVKMVLDRLRVTP